jgi:hypothetical protein
MRAARAAAGGGGLGAHELAGDRRGPRQRGRTTSRAALLDAEDWLAHSEEAVSEWGTGPRSLACKTMAPCLARSLRELRDALRAEDREVPADLDEAEAAAAGVTSHACPRRGAEP